MPVEDVQRRTPAREAEALDGDVPAFKGDCGASSRNMDEAGDFLADDGMVRPVAAVAEVNGPEPASQSGVGPFLQDILSVQLVVRVARVSGAVSRQILSAPAGDVSGDFRERPFEPDRSQGCGALD